MEYLESLNLLRSRLDDSLKQHSEQIDSTDIGSIYELQAYSETHYYMKAVHNYTAAEVEALLSFADPLEVAFWCREENTHTVGLPICDILKEIHADEKFVRLSPELSLKDKTAKLLSRLENNLNNCLDILQQLDDGEIGNRSERIASTFAAYSYFTDEISRNNLEESTIDYLLTLHDPLQYFTEHWPESTLFGDDVLADIQDAVRDNREQGEQPKSVKERLKAAKQKASEQLSAGIDDKLHHKHELR